MKSYYKELEDKREFGGKRIKMLNSDTTILKGQSTKRYTLIKNEVEKLYYIKRNRDSKTILIGDREESEDYILYGLTEHIKQVAELFKA